MNRIRNLLRYLHTIRYLRGTQVYYQARKRLSLPWLYQIEKIPVLNRIRLADWPMKQQGYFGRGRFRFLNCEGDLGWPIDWQGLKFSRLWRYQLHYFDYLHQPGMDESVGLKLMRNWIQRHRPGNECIGWEPYPLSIRIINWLKFLSHPFSPPEDIVSSLYLQAMNLERRLEYHLLGNHLLSNAKALWWAGILLHEPRWTAKGKKIFLSQLKEQFLPDGGHFELSPMYHSVAVEDVLDMVNLVQAGKKPEDAEDLQALRETGASALGWLEGMADENGEVPLLNDAVYGLAPSFEELKHYGELLNLNPSGERLAFRKYGSWKGRNCSGYWVLDRRPFRLVFDAAPLGPDYLPGHSHCDMLALILNFEGERILTDTGVFQYEEGERRSYARGTSAHNTVVIDGRDQAEMWKSFRVGRRGKAMGFQADGHSLISSHTGFSTGNPGLVHTRKISFQEDGFDVTDLIKGKSSHNYKAFLHFAPGVQIDRFRGNTYRINHHLLLETLGGEAHLQTSEYYPEFGKAEKRPCLTLEGSFHEEARFGLKCTFSS